MKEFLKRFLTTQILSIIYSFVTITLFELIIRISVQYFNRLILLILIIISGMGIFCFLISRKYLDTKLISIMLICIPYGFYCLFFLLLYGMFFPTSGVNDNYGLGLIIWFGLIGCWISITIGSFIGVVLHRKANE